MWGWPGSTRVTETSGRPMSRTLWSNMECCLVGDKAGDDRGAVVLTGKAQSVKPGGPSRSQVPLEADFVPSSVMIMAGRCVAHGCSLPAYSTSSHCGYCFV
jgi:hypothetical protein